MEQFAAQFVGNAARQTVKIAVTQQTFQNLGEHLRHRGVRRVLPHASSPRLNLREFLESW